MDFFTAGKMKVTVFSDEMPCILLDATDVSEEPALCICMFCSNQNISRILQQNNVKN